MSTSNFKILVPCGYPPLYRIEGGESFEGIIDAPLLRQPYGCWRSTLPPCLSEIVFWFGELSPYNTVQISNFYHLGEFFVVSDSIRVFLETHANCDFEVERILVKHPRGEVTNQHWAMKVRTTIDCINPDESLATGPNRHQSFSELAVEVHLSVDDAPWFATKGDNYFAYPGNGAQSVAMNFSVVPPGTRLFQPKYWPQYLVIEEAFGRELERQCSGRAPGYYFWTLPMSDIGRQWSSNMHALR